MRRRRKKKNSGLVEITELLEGALKQLGVSGDFEKYRVEKSCREALGEKCTRALTGVSFKKGVVQLEFNHSIWLNEVNFRKREILEKIQRELPGMGIKNLTLALTRNSK
jgi:iron only hydrogenase large subunit-like protein